MTRAGLYQFLCTSSGITWPIHIAKWFSRLHFSALAGVSLFVCIAKPIQAEPAISMVSSTERRAEQQLNMLRSKVFQQHDVLSAVREPEPDKPLFPSESPCFVIRSVEWRNAHEFLWLTADLSVVGACVGAQGLRLYRQWLAAQLLERGFVTSQIGIPAQNLAQGHLIVEIIPGRIGVIREEGPSIGAFRSVFPVSHGELLNVRTLDQALENIRRLPGQSLTTFELVPGESLGESGIVIRHPLPSKRYVGVLTLDNAGITGTGRHQLGTVIAVDSPLGLYDQFLLSYSTDVDSADDARGSNAKSLAWNVPVGYASFSLGASEWGSQRELLKDAAGRSLLLTSKTRRFDAGLSYVAYRSNHGKGTVQARMVRREDRSWVSSTELQQLHRDITSYELGLAHREKLAHSTLDLALGFRGGLPGLSKAPGATYEQQDWDGRYSILTARALLETAFSAKDRAWRYQGSVLVQNAIDPTPSTEYLQIGGRYTVRGFDGDSTLNGPDGWLWRNELATAAFPGSETYAALDAGRVSSIGQQNPGRSFLIGAAMGIRGWRLGFGYDFAVGIPVSKPGALQSRTPTFDFSLSRRF